MRWRYQILSALQPGKGFVFVAFVRSMRLLAGSWAVSVSHRTHGLPTRRMGTSTVRSAALAAWINGPTPATEACRTCPSATNRTFLLHCTLGCGRYQTLGRQHGDSYDNALAETRPLSFTKPPQ